MELLLRPNEYLLWQGEDRAHTVMFQGGRLLFIYWNRWIPFRKTEPEWHPRDINNAGYQLDVPESLALIDILRNKI